MVRDRRAAARGRRLVVLTLLGDDVDGDLYWRVFERDRGGQRRAARPLRATLPRAARADCSSACPATRRWPGTRSFSASCAGRRPAWSLASGRPRWARPRPPRRRCAASARRACPLLAAEIAWLDDARARGRRRARGGVRAVPGRRLRRRAGGGRTSCAGNRARSRRRRRTCAAAVGSASAMSPRPWPDALLPRRPRFTTRARRRIRHPPATARSRKRSRRRSRRAGHDDERARRQRGAPGRSRGGGRVPVAERLAPARALAPRSGDARPGARGAGGGGAPGRRGRAARFSPSGSSAARERRAGRGLDARRALRVRGRAGARRAATRSEAPREAGAAGRDAGAGRQSLAGDRAGALRLGARARQPELAPDRRRAHAAPGRPLAARHPRLQGGRRLAGVRHRRARLPQPAWPGGGPRSISPFSATPSSTAAAFPRSRTWSPPCARARPSTPEPRHAGRRSPDHARRSCASTCPRCARAPWCGAISPATISSTCAASRSTRCSSATSTPGFTQSLAAKQDAIDRGLEDYAERTMLPALERRSRQMVQPTASAGPARAAHGDRLRPRGAVSALPHRGGVRLVRAGARRGAPDGRGLGRKAGVRLPAGVGRARRASSARRSTTG